jgi:eukaryotic-like serine/threonine-protein kinase
MDPNDTTTAGTSATGSSESRLIGRYQVKRLLGSGGMGQVYLAHDPVLDREVAVKLIGSEIDDPQARDRLVQEARAAGRLRHPNIVTIFDAGQHDGAPYIAMEHLTGETLRSLIRRRAPLPLARRLELVEGACAGLAFAHRAHVVHLDVKPDNLMLDANDVVKVLDFGIARVLKSDALVTVHVTGTLRYMSPEQVSGGPLTRRSDVFSLGCSLFEFLTYEPAYTGSAPELISRIAHGPVPRLADVLPSVDPRLDALVARAMSLEPADRFDDLDDLGAALGQLSQEMDPNPHARRASLAMPMSSTPRTASSNTPSPPLRRTILPWVGAASMAVGSAAAWMLLRTPPTAEETFAPPTVTAPEPAPEQPRPAGPVAEPMSDTAAPGAAGAPARPAPAPRPAAPPVSSAAREDVWRRLAGGDRPGVLALLRRIEREEDNPRIAYEVLDAVRPAVIQARTEAGASPAQRTSADYRSGDDSLARANALSQNRQPIDALSATWQAMDLFTRVASARGIPVPGPAPPPSPDVSRGSPPQPAGADPTRPAPSPPNAASDAANGKAARPLPDTAVPGPSVSESEQVLAALRQYHHGYTALDSSAVREMYPTLGAEQVEQLRRSFETVSTYEIGLRQPHVDVSGNAAVVRAVVVRRIVPRVGRPIASEVNTEFRLQRDGRGWLITGVKALP